MRTSSPERHLPARRALDPVLYRLAPEDDADDGSGNVARYGKAAGGREDLPFRVELWDDAKQGVERVLAVAANGSIGYAAFYAATREHPGRYITLRHNNRVVSRWNGPEH